MAELHLVGAFLLASLAAAATGIDRGELGSPPSESAWLRAVPPPPLPPPPAFTAAPVVMPSPVLPSAPVVAGITGSARPPNVLPLAAERAIVGRARLEVERGVQYDATYQRLASYPNGDVPADRGACTDLVVRALRTVGIDLQVMVHEDFVAAPDDYTFGEIGDANVDHRRVPTMYRYFERNAEPLDTRVRAIETFRPGDVIFYAWKRCVRGWPCIPAHVAIVSDRMGPRGLPLVLQNGGPHAMESDVLDRPTMVGHFRLNRAFYARRER